MTDNRVDKSRLLEVIGEARELVRRYDAENAKSPRTRYDYGSVDAVALRLLEQQEGFITVGVTLRGNNVNVHGHRGYLAASGVLIADSQTVTYRLEDFRGTTVARFAHSLCDVLVQRATNGNPDLKELIQSNIAAYAKRTQEEVKQYMS